MQPLVTTWVGGFSALTHSEYARVLAKVAVRAVLVVLGRWARQRWVPAGLTQRGAAALSVRWAVVGVAVMAVAPGLANALAVTG